MHIRSIIITLLLTTVPLATHAGDLSRTDPQRKVILDDIRSQLNGYQGSRFDVKRIWASDQWAYVCALIISDGYYQRTDEAYDVDEFIARKQGGKWRLQARNGGLAGSKQQVDCQMIAGKTLSDATLQVLSKKYKID